MFFKFRKATMHLSSYDWNSYANIYIYYNINIIMVTCKYRVAGSLNVDKSAICIDGLYHP